MVVKSIQATGTHQDIGVIHLENGRRLKWLLFNGQNTPKLPFGTLVKISLTFEERDFLSGVDGIVWATYDREQAETIQNALLAQNILSEIEELGLSEWLHYLLLIPNEVDVQKAIDFIWREATGMRLEPDWWYPAGTQNESFKKWLNGI